MHNVFSYTISKMKSQGVNIVSFNPVYCCDAFGQNTHLHGKTKHEVVRFLVHFENIIHTVQRYGVLGKRTKQ